nr:reverse transcriptase domain-containing protein [Tanacetum cinerariifolium]
FKIRLSSTQFRNTASVKRSDDVTRLQALVDKKKIVISENQVGDLSTHTTRFISPALTQKVFANMRRVGKGFSGVETPLFEGMIAAIQLAKEGLADEQVQVDDAVAAAELSSKTLAETPKLKDKGKGILVETPKPMKKNDQIELDTEYARKLHKEINRHHEEIKKDIDWDAEIDHVKTHWSGPFTITKVFPYGTVELSQPDGPNFKVNGHRVKHYFRGNVPQLWMRTRNPYFPNNSSATILRRRNKRRTPNVVEPELRTIVEMDDNRTMEELLQAPTEGACPHHGFTELAQIDTFYNGLNDNDQDSLNAAAGGNLLSKTTREALQIIENKSKVRYSRNKPNVSRMNTNSRENASNSDDRIDKLADQILTLVDIFAKKIVTPAPVKTNQSSTSGTLLSNTIPNPKGEMKAITTRSGVAYKGPSIPTPKKVVERETEETTDKEQTNIQMPKFASMIKSLLTNKDKLFELAKISLNENCSAMLLKKLPKKLRDPGKFLIPCDFSRMDVCHALADLDASINLMPLSIWKKLSLLKLTPTRMTLELADRSITRPKGVAEDIFVKVGKFHFLTNFVVVDVKADPRVPLILGRPFLRTDRALIDVYGEEITFRQEEVVKAKSSIQKSSELELKDLPSHLEYAYLEGADKLPVLIAKNLKVDEKEALLKVLKSHKRAIAWKIIDIKVYAYEKFRPYPVLSKSIVYTDHSALKYLLCKQDAKPRLIRWVLFLQEFDIIIRDKKGTKNLAADHLSRLENLRKDVFENKDINANFPLETLGKISIGSTPWFADLANFHVGNFIVKGMSSQQKKKFFTDVKHYLWEDPYLF